ncbi:unnamed protein product, partial [Gongylonema pulchrum]|uniref:Phosphoenolpyruvate carboxylase n=1 Tax=Gongylonema pulchrum TaxID=637853 RepID=A0A183DF11_9BILA
MEDGADHEQQLGKLHKLRDVYLQIAKVAQEECPIASLQHS